uniref:Uncharacterized protein n=1 Tax=Cryptomonas curvata TaxID=233186 RepID=A0A7S0MLI9_9CRYP|mmetsp:Transcript_47273/g.98953  ORF Transcript_47273/g.98953 Transcript_47273/m.98953 type:complete len:106 (+) Transcript_47273:203-520(+)|eukprot:CAMPEP_0172179928 /NCGR_PEP_ID=MMETSP1050-20130122/16906_1 /TAXON_ID=233186 /ORGANISM="Cryptomonas curvata, Strain CCAP979/52" /LENGTH=105 /DNA_ID=CAMNT_0012852897 /DNA_START=170 /DNA_END=487 /DNA_ORIENTATION=-
MKRQCTSNECCIFLSRKFNAQINLGAGGSCVGVETTVAAENPGGIAVVMDLLAVELAELLPNKELLNVPLLYNDNVSDNVHISLTVKSTQESNCSPTIKQQSFLS